MKIASLAAIAAATLLSACQTAQIGAQAPAPVASSCADAAVRIRPLAAENEAFNRQIVRTSGRRVARASVDAELSPEDAARREAVITELGALNDFADRNRCVIERPRRRS